jgi:ribosomal protein S18 acetylase RimI-like enzyme
MHIGPVSAVTEEVYEALRRLVPQLGAHKAPPSWQDLEELIRSEASRLVVARVPDAYGPIAGMLCISIYRVPTGIRCVIEDVVVDEAHRRKGVAEGLVRHALDLARQAGADGVSLTSNPGREAANQLYRSMGFQPRQTNPYYYPLK